MKRVFGRKGLYLANKMKKYIIIIQEEVIMKINWKLWVIIIGYGMGIYFSHCEGPGPGAEKWGTVEEDVMRRPGEGLYEPLYTIIDYELSLTGDTAKKLFIKRDDAIEYQFIVDPKGIRLLYKDDIGYFYVAGVSVIDEAHERFGRTLNKEASFIAISSIEIKFLDSRLGNNVIVDYEMGHQFGFRDHDPPIWCIMDDKINPYDPPWVFCLAHRDSLKNLFLGELLATTFESYNSFSEEQKNFLVKESLSLYSDIIYEGEPINFKVWIVNKGEKEIKVSVFALTLEDLFEAWPVIILIKNEKGEIKEIEPYAIPLYAYLPNCVIPPGDSLYYKFSRCAELPPGRYWVKLKKGVLGGKRESDKWITFFVKKHPNKKEKETALPFIQSRLWKDWHPLYQKILFKKAKERNKSPAEFGVVTIATANEFYKRLKKLNENSLYLPYILLGLIDALIRASDTSISYEEFINSECLKDFKRFSNFAYYEDIPLWEAMFLLRRAVRYRDISLYNLGMEKLKEAESKMPKYLYVKLWKDFAQRELKEMVEGGK